MIEITEKDRFLKKHNLTEYDWLELKAYERKRQIGSINMMAYLITMDKKLSNFIMNNYVEFLEVYNQQ